MEYTGDTNFNGAYRKGIAESGYGYSSYYLVIMLLPFLILSNSTILIVLGMIFFGIVLGTYETVMRSAIADITPFHKRGTGL